jgi:hypothetical protein
VPASARVKRVSRPAAIDPFVASIKREYDRHHGNHGYGSTP